MYKTFTFTMTDKVDKGFVNKVQSIKGLRLLSCQGLKEAKEFVERVQEFGTVTEVVNVPELAEKLNEGVAMMLEGGISIIDHDINARIDILAEIKSNASIAVMTGQYDIAKQLITILETTR